MLRRSWILANPCMQRTIRRLSASSKTLSEPLKYAQGLDEEEHQEARTWLTRFTVKDIPKRICEIHFSRASGPGGQNVNKVHTKANLRIKTKDLLPLLPRVVRPKIVSSRYYAKNSESLIISGDGSRTQATNLQECYKKLHNVIVAAGRSTVRGESAPGKIEKAKALSVVPGTPIRILLIKLPPKTREVKREQTNWEKDPGAQESST